MKKITQLLAIVLFALIFSFISCKKMDTISPTQTLNTNALEEKFFNSHRTADPTEKTLIEYLKRVNTKDKFIEQTVKQIGFPRWDKAIANAKKKRTLNSQNLLDDSTQTFYIPFVRDSQNFVNASMIIHTSQTDTSFSYRCDWEYARMENDNESANDPAEHFATFFMVLDKAVFGYNKFNIVDTNLFRTAHGRTKYVRLDSSTTSTGNNFYQLAEFCQDVVYSTKIVPMDLLMPVVGVVTNATFAWNRLCLLTVGKSMYGWAGVEEVEARAVLVVEVVELVVELVVVEHRQIVTHRPCHLQKEPMVTKIILFGIAKVDRHQCLMTMNRRVY